MLVFLEIIFHASYTNNNNLGFLSTQSISLNLFPLKLKCNSAFQVKSLSIHLTFIDSSIDQLSLVAYTVK